MLSTSCRALQRFTPAATRGLSRRMLSTEKPSSAAKPAAVSKFTGPVSWASLALAAVSGAGILAYFNHQREERKKQSNSEVQSVGKALLGGPWELVDSDGKPVTEADFKGQYMLLYFGFTFCPDICPNELVKMGRAIDILEEDADLPKVVPIFITVDPHRDSVAQMKEYVKDFHPRTLALTGTAEQVARATRAFRVYFSNVDHRDEDDDDYVVDHSIVMYFMDRDGEFVKFFPQMSEAPEMAEYMAQHMKKELGLNKPKGILGLFWK